MGQSNILQVYDTKTSEVANEFDYSEKMGKHPIRGMISLGIDDHMVIDKSGKLIVKNSETEKEI